MLGRTPLLRINVIPHVNEEPIQKILPKLENRREGYSSTCTTTNTTREVFEVLPAIPTKERERIQSSVVSRHTDLSRRIAAGSPGYNRDSTWTQCQ